jgi:hypothetical protein
MATSTLVQFLATEADGATRDTSNRFQVETFLASAAIAADAIVSLDLAQTSDVDKALYVITAASGTATRTCVVGAATESAAAAGAKVKVLTKGLYTVAVDGSGTAVAAGDGLCLSGGKLVKVTSGKPVFAVACEAVTTDTTALVYFPPRF